MRVSARARDWHLLGGIAGSLLLGAPLAVQGRPCLRRLLRRASICSTAVHGQPGPRMPSAHGMAGVLPRTLEPPAAGAFFCFCRNGNKGVHGRRCRAHRPGTAAAPPDAQAHQVLAPCQQNAWTASTTGAYLGAPGFRLGRPLLSAGFDDLVQAQRQAGRHVTHAVGPGACQRGDPRLWSNLLNAHDAATNEVCCESRVCCGRRCGLCPANGRFGAARKLAPALSHPTGLRACAVHCFCVCCRPCEPWNADTRMATPSKDTLEDLATLFIYSATEEQLR